MKTINIAIDGPAGAGKSSIAKRCAKELGFIYVDTGALYRSVALFAIRNDVLTNDEAAVLALLQNVNVELKFVDNVQKVYLNGEDVSEAIRQNEVSMGASNVSAIPKVREFLFNLQRRIAMTNNVIMDGRDIGTVVLPDADLKIFMTASPEIRAKRRYLELEHKPDCPSFEALLAEIIQRDYNDSHRETAPLKQADDAVLLDTSELDFEQSVQKVIELIKSVEE
ncbi:MAG: (d)CMP kinase [Oscillospiraceae bacterium]|nr:(d)CMP kinase [Oscillospiraceae bacterium]